MMRFSLNPRPKSRTPDPEYVFDAGTVDARSMACPSCGRIGSMGPTWEDINYLGEWYEQFQCRYMKVPVKMHDRSSCVQTIYIRHPMPNQVWVSPNGKWTINCDMNRFKRYVAMLVIEENNRVFDIGWVTEDGSCYMEHEYDPPEYVQNAVDKVAYECAKNARNT